MEEDFNKEQSIYKQIENNSPDDKILNKIFLAKYIPIQKIGQGAFRSVYKAKGGDEFVAMKFENRSNEYDIFRRRIYDNALFKRTSDSYNQMLLEKYRL